jgi:hypothetical protein
VIVNVEEGIRLDRSWCRLRELRRVLDSQSGRQTPGSPQIGRGEEGEKGRRKGYRRREGGRRGGEYKEEEIEVLSPGGCGKEKKRRRGAKRQTELRQKEKLCGTVMTGFPGGG